MRCALILAVCAMGCGKAPRADQENLVPVTGTVKQNGKSLRRALVNFYPIGETKGVPASGQTGEDGSYELTNVRQNKGVVPGEYKVSISRRLMPDGKEVPEGDVTPPIESPARETIPPRYSDPQASKLRAVVRAGGGPYDFDLK
jgi:hypothetical protein